RAFRSAYELSRLADEVHDYWWDLKVNPTAATAKEIKQLLMIIRRIVKRFSVTDEFDNENITGSDAQAPDDFGYIARLARLQESLDTLYAAGVGVLAASHYHSAVTSAADESPGPKFRIRGTEQILNFHGTLEIRFVPSHVDEYEITVDAGISLEDL